MTHPNLSYYLFSGSFATRKTEPLVCSFAPLSHTYLISYSVLVSTHSQQIQIEIHLQAHQFILYHANIVQATARLHA